MDFQLHCINCTDLSSWPPWIPSYNYLLCEVKTGSFGLIWFLNSPSMRNVNNIRASCSPLPCCSSFNVSTAMLVIVVIRFIAFPIPTFCTLLLQILSSLNPSLLFSWQKIIVSMVLACCSHCLSGWAALCMGFFLFPPHLHLTICLLSTNARLCQTNLIASFDKITDFLVKGNALDSIYLGSRNAFDMG